MSCPAEFRRRPPLITLLEVNDLVFPYLSTYMQIMAKKPPLTRQLEVAYAGVTSDGLVGGGPQLGNSNSTSDN